MALNVHINIQFQRYSHNAWPNHKAHGSHVLIHRDANNVHGALFGCSVLMNCRLSAVHTALVVHINLKPFMIFFIILSWKECGEISEIKWILLSETEREKNRKKMRIPQDVHVGNGKPSVAIVCDLSESCIGAFKEINK